MDLKGTNDRPFTVPFCHEHLLRIVKMMEWMDLMVVITHNTIN